ncbi:MAG: antibiotic biosynthesis monooxygenase [Gammaproteobacteria bacterium]|nr:antibiotic biosynthesis monooxygenase [Gammaproteobacteria bacterium]MCP5200367.1 antibiotic biosynthesis monooxygenase [Gammaproteobacteria bacterium]
MTCTVLLEMRFKKEAVDGMAEGFKGLLPDTRSFEGCIEVYPTQNQDDPQVWVIVENWTSRQAYEKYFQWRVDRGDIDNLASMLEGEPSIRYFDRIGA